MNRRDFFKAVLAAPLALLKLPETLIAEEEVVNVPHFGTEEPFTEINFAFEKSFMAYATNGVVWTVSPDGGKTWKEVEV